jgi:hypothetical protein
MSSFAERLRLVGFSTYADYLKSAGWLEFRRRYFASGKTKRCCMCDCRNVQLHHKTYVRLGMELFDDVIPLCHGHHDQVHAWLKAKGLPVEETPQAIDAMGGVLPNQTGKKNRKKRKKQQKAWKKTRVSEQPVQIYEKTVAEEKLEAARVKKEKAEAEHRRLHEAELARRAAAAANPVAIANAKKWEEKPLKLVAKPRLINHSVNETLRRLAEVQARRGGATQS